MADDTAIVAGFECGDGEAVLAVRKWIEGVVYLGGWKFEDPESVVQEILLKLVEIVRDGRFRGRSSFKTFATAVAKRMCIDVYRHEKPRYRFVSVDPAVLETRPDTAAPDRDLEHKESLAVLRYIVQKLPEECRRLLGMVYREGLSAPEVARKLGITPVNARVRTHRCVGKARTLGQGYLGGLEGLSA